MVVSGSFFNNNHYSFYQNEDCDYSNNNSPKNNSLQNYGSKNNQNCDYENYNEQKHDDLENCYDEEQNYQECIDQIPEEECVDEIPVEPPVIPEEECVDEVPVEIPVAVEICKDEALSELIYEFECVGADHDQTLAFLQEQNSISTDESGLMSLNSKGTTLSSYLQQLLNMDYRQSMTGTDQAIDQQITEIFDDMVDAGLEPVRSIQNLAHQNLIQIASEGAILPTDTLVDLELEFDDWVA